MIADFILEQVAAPGVGSFTLGTPVSGRLPWSAGVTAGLYASGGAVYYFANDGVQQEWGVGTYTAGTLARTTVIWTSAGSTTKLNFATLPVYVYPEIPAARSVLRNQNGILLATYDISSPTQNGGPLAGTRNRLINPGFQINQRGYVSNTALTAGTYAHDKWKAGAGGCTYTFTGSQLQPVMITITAGTLQQVIEARSIEGGSYMLSWQGTATARLGAGAYGSSPILTSGFGAGANLTVEFNTGTVLQPQLETGNAGASQFEIRLSPLEQTLCDRFYTQGSFSWQSYGAAGVVASMLISLPTSMRTAPSLVLNATTNTNCGTNALATLNNRDLKLATTVTALGSFIFLGNYTATADF
jgi:hypothetical protein